MEAAAFRIHLVVAIQDEPEIDFNIVSYELKVYNRWGQQIFTTNNLSQSWDGTHIGQPAPMDNYTYHTEGITSDGIIFSVQGTVLLVR